VALYVLCCELCEMLHIGTIVREITVMFIESVWSRISHGLLINLTESVDLLCGLGGQSRGRAQIRETNPEMLSCFLLQCTDDCSQMHFAAFKRKIFARNLDFSHPAEISRTDAVEFVPICVCLIFVFRRACSYKIVRYHLWRVDAAIYVLYFSFFG